MTTGLIVPFHRYPGMVSHNDQILFDYFLKSMTKWGDNFDTIYLINSNDYFSEAEQKELVANHFGKLIIVATHNLSHAQNLNTIFPMVEEEIVCIIDHDTLIYDNMLAVYLKQIEKYDVAAFIERPDSARLSRFAPYFFIGKRSIFPAKPDFSEDPEHNHLDPFAKLTHQLLASGTTFTEVPDDRSTIQLMEDGSINRTPAIPALTGVYHVRNFVGGLILIETYQNDTEDFHRRFDTMPFSEVTRLLGWLWLLNSKTRENKALFENILKIVTKEMGIGTQAWLTYMIEFERYHHYL